MNTQSILPLEQVLEQVAPHVDTQCGAIIDFSLDAVVTSVLFTVSDNGVGILPENLVHLFTHGFTTKKDGYGFGLHSAGLGQGAEFILELPLTKPALAANPPAVAA